MYDFRDERLYKMYLIAYIVHNFATNTRSKKILTIRKLELLYFVIRNPIKLKVTLEKLGLGTLKNYKPLLYDCSLVAEDFDSSDNIRENIIHLLELGKIESVVIEGNRYFYSEFFKDVEAPNDFINSNFKNIKKLASQTESKLIKTIIGF